MVVALIFCILCLVLEIVGFILVALHYGSACIQAGEITKNAYVYLIFIYSVATSDLFYSIFTIFKKETTIRDFGILYHLATFIFSIAGGVVICIGLTFCGNSAQMFFAAAGVLAILAGLLHGLALFFIRRELPPGTKFGKN